MFYLSNYFIYLILKRALIELIISFVLSKFNQFFWPSLFENPQNDISKFYFIKRLKIGKSILSGLKDRICGNCRLNQDYVNDLVIIDTSQGA